MNISALFAFTVSYRSAEKKYMPPPDFLSFKWFQIHIQNVIYDMKNTKKRKAQLLNDP